MAKVAWMGWGGVGSIGGSWEKGSTINGMSHKMVEKRDNVSGRAGGKVDFVCDNSMLVGERHLLYLFLHAQGAVSLRICCSCVGV